MPPIEQTDGLKTDIEARDDRRGGHEEIVRDDERPARGSEQSEHSVTVRGSISALQYRALSGGATLACRSAPGTPLPGRGLRVFRLPGPPRLADIGPLQVPLLLAATGTR